MKAMERVGIRKSNKEGVEAFRILGGGDRVRFSWTEKHEKGRSSFRLSAVSQRLAFVRQTSKTSARCDRVCLLA
jgi:hypothetical protein